jgi:hypothetical protein
VPPLQRGDRKAPALSFGDAAQLPEREQRNPPYQREHAKAAKESAGRDQRQLGVADLPQQQREEHRDAQAVGGKRHRLRRGLLAADHAVVRHVAQLEHRRQREADQQQQAGRHALHRGQQRNRRQVGRDHPAH